MNFGSCLKYVKFTLFTGKNTVMLPVRFQRGVTIGFTSSGTVTLVLRVFGTMAVAFRVAVALSEAVTFCTANKHGSHDAIKYGSLHVLCF